MNLTIITNKLKFQLLQAKLAYVGLYTKDAPLADKMLLMIYMILSIGDTRYMEREINSGARCVSLKKGTLKLKLLNSHQ